MHHIKTLPFVKHVYKNYQLSLPLERQFLGVPVNCILYFISYFATVFVYNRYIPLYEVHDVLRHGPSHEVVFWNSQILQLVFININFFHKVRIAIDSKRIFHLFIQFLRRRAISLTRHHISSKSIA